MQALLQAAKPTGRIVTVPSTNFGQPLRLRFYAISDGAKPTIFRVNDVSASANISGGSGSVNCVINPTNAVNAGAQWNLDGGSWKNSGVTQNASVGNHSVNFNSISGWTSPASQNITVTNGNTYFTSETYIQGTPTNHTISGIVYKFG